VGGGGDSSGRQCDRSTTGAVGQGGVGGGRRKEKEGGGVEGELCTRL
jgi:hypothetical protein